MRTVSPNSSKCIEMQELTSKNHDQKVAVGLGPLLKQYMPLYNPLSSVTAAAQGAIHTSLCDSPEAEYAIHTSPYSEFEGIHTRPVENDADAGSIEGKPIERSYYYKGTGFDIEYSFTSKDPQAANKLQLIKSKLDEHADNLEAKARNIANDKNGWGITPEELDNQVKIIEIRYDKSEVVVQLGDLEPCIVEITDDSDIKDMQNLMKDLNSTNWYSYNKGYLDQDGRGYLKTSIPRLLGYASRDWDEIIKKDMPKILDSISCDNKNVVIKAIETRTYLAKELSDFMKDFAQNRMQTLDSHIESEMCEENIKRCQIEKQNWEKFLESIESLNKQAIFDALSHPIDDQARPSSYKNHISAAKDHRTLLTTRIGKRRQSGVKNAIFGANPLIRKEKHYIDATVLLNATDPKMYMELLSELKLAKTQDSMERVFVGLITSLPITEGTERASFDTYLENYSGKLFEGFGEEEKNSFKTAVGNF